MTTTTISRIRFQLKLAALSSVGKCAAFARAASLGRALNDCILERKNIVHIIFMSSCYQLKDEPLAFS